MALLVRDAEAEMRVEVWTDSLSFDSCVFREGVVGRSVVVAYDD